MEGEGPLRKLLYSGIVHLDSIVMVDTAVVMNYWVALRFTICLDNGSFAWRVFNYSGLIYEVRPHRRVRSVGECECVRKEWV